jgi:hypothetical protein
MGQVSEARGWIHPRAAGPVLLVTAVLLAACGGKASPPSSPTVTATATKAPAKTPAPLTSTADLTACGQLEQVVQAVSALVSHTTEDITQAVNPAQLAKRTNTAQHSLLDSARLVELVHATPPLLGAQHDLAKGLRMFAADFARASASAKRGEVNRAAAQTVDEQALRKMQVSVKRIDDLCGR